MKIIDQYVKENMCYDGSQIQPLWALDKMGIKGSSVVSWMGPMEIDPKKIIDVEDVGLEIKSDKMIHFIVEHFDCQPTNIKLCYHRQRILVMILKDELSKWGVESNRSGDDLFVGAGKLTVSIATISTTSMKIHLGVNITSEGTPEDVETVGLLEIGNINESDLLKIIKKVSKLYINEIESIEMDISKTRSF
ncbi:MAG TPA: DUF366 family protein [Methanobacteriaceae archaeon]|nr:DUF366 family protein [Methanobacteriaceae archaeon]